MKKVLLVSKLMVSALFLFTLTILFTHPVLILNEPLAYTEVEIDESKEDNYILNLREQYYNDDIIAAISISDTPIKGIIAQTDNNSYYLNYNLFKQRDYKGSLFMDYRVDVNDSLKLLVYGHMSYSDATPFAHLKNYLDEEYFLEHSELKFITENEVKTYKIFGVTVYSSNYDYLNVSFDNQEDYLDNLNSYTNRALFYDGYTFTGDEETIFLQTCYPHQKGSYIVVGARRIS